MKVTVTQLRISSMSFHSSKKQFFQKRMELIISFFSTFFICLRTSLRNCFSFSQLHPNWEYPSQVFKLMLNKMWNETVIHMKNDLNHGLLPLAVCPVWTVWNFLPRLRSLTYLEVKNNFAQNNYFWCRHHPDQTQKFFSKEKG